MQIIEHKLSILIVDDSATVRMFIERAIHACNRDVDIVAVDNGEDALKLLRLTAFDIAFLDLQMPTLGGVEVMGAIQMMNGTTFAVAMSDKLNERAEALLKSFGAYDFLTKPFGEAAVRRVIESFEVIRTPQNVLIVDDSATVRRVVRKVIGRSIFNLNMVEAADGPSAIDAVRAKSFRIIFTDFNMPRMTGVELAAELAALSRGSDVILMSSEYNSAIHRAAQQVGARAFLNKPFYPEDVDTILHHLFGLQHSRFGKSVKLFATV